MLGFLGRFWTPIVHVTPLETPFGLVIPLFTIPITRHYNYTQLFLMRLRVYTIIVLTRTELQSLIPLLHDIHSLCALHFNAYCTTAHKVSYYNHLAHSCTGWLLSYQLLCRIITHTSPLNTSKLSPRSHSVISLLITNFSWELPRTICVGLLPRTNWTGLKASLYIAELR
jgi:hypothetical protein